MDASEHNTYRLVKVTISQEARRLPADGPALARAIHPPPSARSSASTCASGTGGGAMLLRVGVVVAFIVCLLGAPAARGAQR